MLAALGDEPDYGPAYAARAHLTEAMGGDPGPDFRRAVTLDPGSRLPPRGPRPGTCRKRDDGRRRWMRSGRAGNSSRGDFNLGLLHVRGLLQAGEYGEAIRILADTRVLPSENARESTPVRVRARRGPRWTNSMSGDRAAAATSRSCARVAGITRSGASPSIRTSGWCGFCSGWWGESAGGGPGAGSADAAAANALRARADSLAGAASPTEVIERALVRARWRRRDAGKGGYPTRGENGESYGCGIARWSMFLRSARQL